MLLFDRLPVVISFFSLCVYYTLSFEALFYIDVDILDTGISILNVILKIILFVYIHACVHKLSLEGNRRSW